jgi:hypothetical protein
LDDQLAIPSVGTMNVSPILYTKMTVTELKDELRARNLAVTGKKTELIERLMMADVVR